MGVFTRLDESELGALAAAFGRRLLGARGVEAGSVNTWYALETDAGPCFLRLDERGDLAAVEVELRILDRLRGLRVPEPLAAVAGRRWVTHRGKPALLFPALPGVSPQRLELPQLRALGRWMAEAQGRPAADLPLHPFAAGPLSTRYWLPLRARIFAEAPDAAAALAPVFDGPLRAWDFPALPQALVHADLFAENVLFATDGSLSAVLDFEAAGRGPRILDLAITILANALEGGRIDRARASAVFEGWRDACAATPAERAAWPRVLRFAALRFALSRLRDFEFGVPGRPQPVYRDYREMVAALPAVEGVADLC